MTSLRHVGPLFYPVAFLVDVYLTLLSRPRPSVFIGKWPNITPVHSKLTCTGGSNDGGRNDTTLTSGKSSSGHVTPSVQWDKLDVRESSGCVTQFKTHSMNAHSTGITSREVQVLSREMRSEYRHEVQKLLPA